MKQMLPFHFTRERIAKLCSRSGFLLGVLCMTVSSFSQALQRGSDSDTLALIGNRVITSAEFSKSYKDRVLRLGLTDNGDTRRKYLQNLISDEVLIIQAKRTGLDKTDTARKEYKRIQTQELLNAFSEKHIEPKLIITEDELKSLYIKMNTKIKVSHLYAATLESANALYNSLQQGETFESLAKNCFRDPKLRDHGGELGYITVDEMDPEFEKAAYSMRPGDISKPVKTVEGYSIIKVEDIQQNPLNTENEFLKARDRLKAFARKRAYEDAVKQYTAELHEKLTIKFNEPIVEDCFKTIRQDSLGNILAVPQTEAGNDMDKVLVTSKLGKWSLKRTLKELSLSGNDQKKWIRTPENLQDFISGLIIRQQTVQTARKERSDTAASFKQKVEFDFGTFLMRQVENELRTQINISEDSIKAYYEENKDRFQTEPETRLSSILLNDARLADSVKQLLEAGSRFESLARKYSTQVMTAEYDGDMGYFKKNDLGSLSDRAFSLNPGQWTGPIQDEGKFLFLKCTELKRPVTKPFAEVAKEIGQTLTTVRWYKIRDAYVKSLEKNIRVKIFSEKLNTRNFITKVDQQ